MTGHAVSAFDIRTLSNENPDGLRDAAADVDYCPSPLLALTKSLGALLSDSKGFSFRGSSPGETEPGIDLNRHQEAYDALWLEIARFSGLLAQMRAQSLHDLAAKIEAWKLIAPESLFNEEEQSVDESLLVSIIDDTLRLTAQHPALDRP